MRVRFAIVPTIVLMMAMVFAVPADAKKPAGFDGTQYLNFNSGFMGTTCPHITWVGNVEVDDVEYGITYQPTGSRTTGKAFHFEEIWTIYEEDFDFEGGFFTDCDAAVAMWGYDAGMLAPNGHGLANGTVEQVTDDGPFAVSLTGRQVHWSGDVGMNDAGGETFFGPFRIN
jgi:hypothetical protein